MKSVHWMAKHHVAANLLMLFLLVGGLVSASRLKVEVFPEVELDRITVAVAYPGAGPKEVEEGICLPIEEAVNGVDGVKRVTANAAEGGAAVLIELLDSADPDEVTQDVKSAVDRIVTFPQDAERPVISKLVTRQQVLSLVVYGDVDRHALREQAERVRDELLAKPNITQADLMGVPPYEISIEVGQEQLRRYGLTLDQIAASIRSASLDLPAGAVKADGGEILLRTKERRYTAREYEDIVVLSKPDGTLLRVRDVGKARDTFEETDEAGFFNGRPAAIVSVYRIGDQSPTDLAKTIHRYIEEQRGNLPPAISLSVWDDRSEILAQRMDLLLRNAALGLALVILVLGLFMEIKLAFWVTLGIPISMLGAMVLMPWLGVSINMISLFAFILVLGIVVDDAIVVGENVYAQRQMGRDHTSAAIEGAIEVGRPVIFSVLTTVAAFMPLMFISGMMGKFMWAIPAIVVSVLMVSLVESLYVLPAHLNKKWAKDPNKKPGLLSGWHLLFGRMLQWVRLKPYRKTLQIAIRYRYATLALAIASLALTIGLFAGGFIKTVFMPQLEGDIVKARLSMPFGTPAAVTERHMRRIYAEAKKVVAAYDSKLPRGKSPDGTVLRNIYSQVGSFLQNRGPRGAQAASGSHLGEVAIFLKPTDQRNVNAGEFADAWRKRVGEVPGAESLLFESKLVHMGEPIDIQLAHSDFSALQAAADRVKKELGEYPGLYDIADSYEEGKAELKLRLRPEARALGVSQQDLARQVRGAFYGAEALRLQRGRNEVKVMVRYPLAERRGVANVESMLIRTAKGGEIPFAEAAYVDEGRGYSTISRVDRKRVIDVTAKANMRVANPNEVMRDMEVKILPKILADYPGMTFSVQGEQREQAESMGTLRVGMFAALGLIFCLLAIPSRSYAQPLIIMTAIPFGLIGAVLGHLLLGYNMSLMSFFGVVALAGVVVNDSLVLVDFINRLRERGVPVRRAVLEAGQRRFRPIVLTTLTTFFALMPMLTETSVQARFLVPMAISLAFGVLGATLITLVLVPTLYVVLDDAQQAIAWATGRSTRRRAPAEPADPVQPEAAS